MIKINYPLFLNKNDRLRAWRMEFFSEVANPICITNDNGFHLTLSNEQAQDLISKLLTVLEANNVRDNQV